MKIHFPQFLLSRNDTTQERFSAVTFYTYEQLKSNGTLPTPSPSLCFFRFLYANKIQRIANNILQVKPLYRSIRNLAGWLCLTAPQPPNASSWPSDHTRTPPFLMQSLARANAMEMYITWSKGTDQLCLRKLL